MPPPYHHVPSPPTGENRGPFLNRVSAAVYSVAVAVVVLRFYTRGYMVRKFGVDDYFIASSIADDARIFGAGQTATNILQVKNGRGRHTAEMSIEQINEMLLYKWINLYLYFVANWSVKMSILALYYRIASGKRGLPWVLQTNVIWAMAGFITAFTISICMAEVFACRPISRSWDVEKLPMGCMFAAMFNTSQASINVFTDMVLLVFPMPLLRQLHVNTTQRFALVFIFCVGAIPLAASAMRLNEVIISATPEGESWLVADSVWKWSLVPMWSQIEVDAGIVAASLPCLSPLMKRLWIDFVTFNRSNTRPDIATLKRMDEQEMLPEP
ncbi:hypothetical protein K504DRAFT_420571 [Pleomassaria siparia CBS 279.74]|uniref:Rhodopsin domain-containing protein n=1 Tax=Pleomassaria siparia CBS 279.74 TaxID=1314801 RepID=A0A6G1KQE3_9PLEO|nr:hypothetical protein K504DRAFT_420571 [Pleomassaria siparia CBS 279.74]